MLDADDLTQKFVRSFTKAIRFEMNAMKRRLGSFEVWLSGDSRGETLYGSADTSESVVASADESGRMQYVFGLILRDQKLIPGIECTYRSGGTDVLVTVTNVDETTVTVESSTPLDITSSNKLLVIYPWFLYERLIDGLEAIGDDATFNPTSALRAFGKSNVSRFDLDCELHESTRDVLNSGQIEAVSLCLSHDLAFIWGPPGTGKTTTLASLLYELMLEEGRVLVASTTNAAVDQVAATLIRAGSLDDRIRDGQIVRIGDCGHESRLCSLEVVRRKLRASRKRKTDEVHHRIESCTRRIADLEALLLKVKMIGDGGQFELFEPRSDDDDFVDEFVRLLGPDFRESASSPDREKVLEEHIAGTRLELAKERGNSIALRAKAEATDSEIISRARIVLTTMANLYVNERLQRERFDTVILEEAGMALLPSVFYCAAIAKKRIACIGDPRQLPPIVQSDSEYAVRAMGRSIFEVTVPDGAESSNVALLSRQYRMHPAIRSIVSEVFYDGLLGDDPSVGERESIASNLPFSGEAVKVVDLAGASRCVRAEGSGSRVNEYSAERAVELAAEAHDSGLDSVGIITPYVAQAKFIRERLYNAKLTGIECSTVHKFQGHECDCIIFDFTDADPMEPGVLLVGDGFERQSANLLNVSISRARGKLILLAEVSYFLSRDTCGTVNRILNASSAV